MKANKISFPYPVLGIGDDIAGDFRLDFIGGGVDMDRESIKIEVEFKLSNKTLEKLIRENRAHYCLEIECPQTIFRKCYISKDPKQSIQISAEELRNKTNVTAFIVASNKIANYVPAGLNADYGKSSFSPDKGNALAFYDAGWFLAGKTWEAMRAVSSIISVEEDKKGKGGITFNLTDEKIVVKMPTESFQRYGRLYKVPGIGSIFHASVALPAVMYALSEMMGKEEENIGSAWYEILEVRRQQDPTLKGISWELSNVPAIAQALLGSPIAGTLKDVENILNAEFSSTDS